MWPNECQVKGNNHFPPSTAPVNMPQMLLSFAVEETLLAHVHYLPILTESLCSLAVPSHDWYKGLVQASTGLWHLSLLNFMIFMSVHSSSLSLDSSSPLDSSPAFQHENCTPSLVSSPDLVSKQHSVTFSRSLIKMLNRTRPSTGGFNAPLVRDSR